MRSNSRPFDQIEKEAFMAVGSWSTQEHILVVRSWCTWTVKSGSTWNGLEGETPVVVQSWSTCEGSSILGLMICTHDIQTVQLDFLWIAIRAATHARVAWVSAPWRALVGPAATSLADVVWLYKFTKNPCFLKFFSYRFLDPVLSPNDLWFFQFFRV